MQSSFDEFLHLPIYVKVNLFLPPFPKWWDNLPPLDQKIARQQYHLCCWGYSHHSGTELLPTHGPSPPRCNSLLRLNVLLAGDWGWIHWEPFYLPYHEPPLVVEWQRHTYSFLLDTKPLWHKRKWKSWPAGEGDPWQRPPSPISCPEDHRLLVTIVVKHWPLTICSWSLQCYRDVVMNTTQLTHWIPSLRQFPRLA